MCHVFSFSLGHSGHSLLIPSLAQRLKLKGRGVVDQPVLSTPYVAVFDASHYQNPKPKSNKFLERKAVFKWLSENQNQNMYYD